MRVINFRPSWLWGTAGLILGVAAALPNPGGRALAQDAAGTEEIVFVPPVDGAPGGRIGAGTRGTGEASNGIRLIAPPGGGLTASPSPKLFWWLDEPFSGVLWVELLRDGSQRTLLRLREKVTLKAGLNAFDLADLGLRIAEVKIYQWTVTLEPDGGRPAMSATSFVELRPAAVTRSAGDARQTARSLARRGYWYDAFALMAANPSRAGDRDALLKQAGIRLPE